MSTKKQRKEFEPRVIAEVRFASNGDEPGNGDMKFRIVQVTVNGGCVVEQLIHDLTGDKWEKQNHTRSIDKAWSSIRYQAGITYKTERSLGAPETDPLQLKPRSEHPNDQKNQEHQKRQAA